MSTHTKDPAVAAGPEKADGRHWLVVLVVGVLAAVVGLGVGYLVFSPSPDSAVDADVQALVDDFTTAANTGDPDAVLALFTEDAHMFDYDLATAPDSIVRNTINTWEGLIEPGDTILVTGDLPQYRVATLGTYGGDEYLYVFKIDQVDGKLLISYLDTADSLQ